MSEWNASDPLRSIVLTPDQACRNLMAADARNLASIGPATPNGFVRDVVCDCAMRFIEAKRCDALVGGVEHQRAAGENLRIAVLAYAARHQT